MRISPSDPVTDNDTLLTAFHAHLLQQDLAPTTIRNYLHDLKLFQDWLAWLYEAPAIALRQVATADLATFRQHLVQEKSHRPTTINRRLQSLRLFYRWLKPQHAAAENPAEHLRYLRTVRRPRPAALERREALALVRAAATSPHGMAKRNVALVQLLLQTGLRVSEVAALRQAEVQVGHRAGVVRVRAGKGLKAREVPLNTTARRALQTYQATRPTGAPNQPVFFSKRATALSVRAIQSLIAALARRAGITRLAVSAHALRHTFAVNYLRQNPGNLIELASLLGHESLDTTALYARPSADDLADDLERSALNVLSD